MNIYFHHSAHADLVSMRPGVEGERGGSALEPMVCEGGYVGGAGVEVDESVIIDCGQGWTIDGSVSRL